MAFATVGDGAEAVGFVTACATVCGADVTAVGVVGGCAEGSVGCVTAWAITEAAVEAVVWAVEAVVWAAALTVGIPSACASTATEPDSARTPAEIAVMRRPRAASAPERGCLPRHPPLTTKRGTTQILSSTCNSDSI